MKKEKTLYTYVEYNDYGADILSIYVREDGIVSYRFGGWRNKYNRKVKVKSNNGIKYKSKRIYLFNESWKGYAVRACILVNYMGEIGKPFFLLVDAESQRRYNRKLKAKRYRGLGYNQLNKNFSGCHGHHIDKENVLHIPANLHKSVSHNVFTGRGMREINSVAFQWIATQENFEGLKKIGGI